MIIILNIIFRMIVNISIILLEHIPHMSYL